MIKTYRSKFTIQAEQFDGTAEMMKKYGIKCVDRAVIEGTEAEYGPETHYYMYIDYTKDVEELEVGDWLITSREIGITIMWDKDFHEQYSEV